MLRPDDRHHLLELLRPPVGYAFDTAVGTTFTLDLHALLSVPLGFALFDWEEEEGRPTADPLLLLESIRRTSERFVVFCQKGQILVPGKYEQLFAWIEPSIVEAGAPKAGGLFHPKVWVIRFVDARGSVVYRFLCSSRNLTFDRSWDTVVCLEGSLVDRKVAYSRNHPLGDFVRRLPSLSSRRTNNRIRGIVDTIQDEVRRVNWEIPEEQGFSDLRFWSLGFGRGSKWPFDSSGRRTLIVSPFLSNETVSRLASRGSQDVLISRQESLEALDVDVRARFGSTLVLMDTAFDESDVESSEPQSNSRDSGELEGLHMKYYVTEKGWDASVWTGSANATEAALNRNVEFMVELWGRKSRVGIEAFLGPDSGGGFKELLTEFEPAEDAQDEDADKLAGLVRSAKQALAASELTAHFEDVDGSNYSVRVVRDNAPLSFPPDVTVTCRPISIRRELAAQTSETETVAEFPTLSYEGITPFFCFRIEADCGKASAFEELVLMLPMKGAPRDRHDRVLQTILGDKEKVMRLIMLLLFNDGVEGAGLSQLFRGRNGRAGGSNEIAELPLLESLLRSLHRGPSRLTEVGNLVRRISELPNSNELLPESFRLVWEPVSRVLEEIQRDRK